jgi:thiol-disulfide isomerase/thioredoxin
MRIAGFVFFVLILSSFTMKKEIPVVDFSGLQPILDRRDDTTYIVNFWATWCAPCIKELPAFEQIHSKYGSEKVRVILVSLDMPWQLESKLIPFVEEKQLQPEVILLNDPHSNSWIDKVDPAWSGAIPATVIYNRDHYRFYEQSFTYAQLEEIVNEIMIK